MFLYKKVVHLNSLKHLGTLFPCGSLHGISLMERVHCRKWVLLPVNLILLVFCITLFRTCYQETEEFLCPKIGEGEQLKACSPD
jgi:hypothetical protein